MHALWQNKIILCQYINTLWQKNLSSFFFIPTVVSGVGRLLCEILAETDPTPSKKAKFHITHCYCLCICDWLLYAAVCLTTGCLQHHHVKNSRFHCDVQTIICGMNLLHQTMPTSPSLAVYIHTQLLSGWMSSLLSQEMTECCGYICECITTTWLQWTIKKRDILFLTIT